MVVWFAKWQITHAAIDSNGCGIEWGHWGSNPVLHPCPISARQHTSRRNNYDRSTQTYFWQRRPTSLLLDWPWLLKVIVISHNFCALRHKAIFGVFAAPVLSALRGVGAICARHHPVGIQVAPYSVMHLWFVIRNEGFFFIYWGCNNVLRGPTLLVCSFAFLKRVVWVPQVYQKE